MDIQICRVCGYHDGDGNPCCARCNTAFAPPQPSVAEAVSEVKADAKSNGRTDDPPAKHV